MILSWTVCAVGCAEMAFLVDLTLSINGVRNFA